MTLTDLSWNGFPRSVYRDRRKAWNPYPRYAGTRIEYAARLATAHWRELARAGKISLVDTITFKLAVLDKVWEINLEHRAIGEKLENYIAWRALADEFVDSAFELANLSVPAEARPSPAAQKEMRAFVSSMANFGFRSWVDSHGTMPDNVLPRVATFDFSQLGKYDPESPQTLKDAREFKGNNLGGSISGQPMCSEIDDGDESDGAETTNPEDPLGRVGSVIEWERRTGRMLAVLFPFTVLWLYCVWSTTSKLFPGTAPLSRLVGLMITALWIADKMVEKVWKKTISQCVRGLVRGWACGVNEWMLGVPPRPARTPVDAPVDRYREREDEKPILLMPKLPPKTGGIHRS